MYFISTVAKRYGINPAYVASLRRGDYREFAGGPIGIRRRPRPLSDAKALAIYADAQELTARHGISMATLRHVTAGRTYKAFEGVVRKAA